MGFVTPTLTWLLALYLGQGLCHSNSDMALDTVSRARDLSLSLKYGFGLRSLDIGFVTITKASGFLFFDGSQDMGFVTVTKACVFSL